MGRSGDGVEIREHSIRLSFTLDGKRERQTLMVNGEPMKPTPANVKYAHRLAQEIRDRIKHGTFSIAEYFPASGSGRAATLADAFETWIGAQRIEESTRSGYRSAITYWNKHLPDRPLRALKHSEILRVIAESKLTGKGLNNYISVLRKALELAVIDKLIPSSPADGIKRQDHQKDPPDPFSADERDRIIAEAHARYPGQVANMIEFWAWTGLRTSELFALRWSNADLASGSFVVREAVVRGVWKNRTKTNVERIVRLNSRAAAALQRQRAHTQLAGEHVFTDPRYAAPWIVERAFRRSYWTPLLKLLGIRYRRPYQLRHTYATAMLMADVKPAFAAKQLGHSIEMFLRTYSKWMHGAADDREMAKLEGGSDGDSQSSNARRD